MSNGGVLADHHFVAGEQKSLDFVFADRIDRRKAYLHRREDTEEVEVEEWPPDNLAAEDVSEEFGICGPGWVVVLGRIRAEAV